MWVVGLLLVLLLGLCVVIMPPTFDWCLLFNFFLRFWRLCYWFGLLVVAC